MNLKKYTSTIRIEFPESEYRQSFLKTLTLNACYKKFFSSLTNSSHSSYIHYYQSNVLFITSKIFFKKKSSNRLLSVKSSPHVHKSYEQLVEKSQNSPTLAITITSFCKENVFSSHNSFVESVESGLNKILSNSHNVSLNSSLNLNSEELLLTHSKVSIIHQK
jgi:hypothetical protein